jgi:CBS domain
MNVAAILRLKGRGVVTTTKDKSLLDIAKLLDQHGIGCIVIEGDNGKVAGIVSERDLMRAIGQSGPKVLKEPVSDFMTKTVVTARARGRERPSDRPRLHRRRGQDADRGSRDGDDRDAGVRRLLPGGGVSSDPIAAKHAAYKGRSWHSAD